MTTKKKKIPNNPFGQSGVAKAPNILKRAEEAGMTVENISTGKPKKATTGEARYLLCRTLCSIIAELATDAELEIKNGIVYVYCKDEGDGLGAGYWDFTVPLFHPEKTK